MNKLTLVCFLLTITRTTVPAQSTEETAIKTVIERETQSWLNRDAYAIARCWAAVSYATHLGLRTDGKAFFSTNEQGQITQTIRNVSLQAAQPDRSTFANSDNRIRINGTSAFVTFAQLRTAPEGHVEQYYQTRNMEKQQGSWQIVHASALFRHPENK
ncbi:nuclear transport factor 2 family protein [Spirosoma pollinicola]|uniref:Uncharacterized protein n=1 Tax=Spirosoma pollinicola TaxID=2057025 RepID=A0A2K8YWS5_9BACT|nr:nuclear transport factor 2 family protein [Spirosoma pollinicola]AUD02090.1 hypothetical protein CWM47_09835 [Spirosoma pollinicola]